jgi:hypothetical protein
MVTGWRIAKLRDMRLFEGYPFHRIDIETEAVGEDAPQPGYRCNRIRSNTDPLAVEIARSEHTSFRVVDDVRMLEAPDYDSRQQYERLAVRLGHEERHDREFRAVEFQIPHDALESGAWRFHVRVLQRNEVRADVALFHCRGNGVIAQQHRDVQ